MGNRINWDIFDENSSSAEAILFFAIGMYSFPELRKQMWDRSAKAEVDKLRKMGRKKALRLARAQCTRRGIDYKEFCPRCGM